MCMYTKAWCVEEAPRNIQAWKVLVKVFRDKTVYFAPFWNFEYEMERTYKLTHSVLEIFRLKIETEGAVYQGFHSFTNKEDALTYKELLGMEGLLHDSRFGVRGSLTVVEVQVPEGSKYVLGKQEDFESMVSDQITIKGEVEVCV